MRKERTKREEILDAAERMIRRAGYNGFSTRDVADAVGIRAASVHYHFPTKADIGAAVTERYTEQFLAKLGDPAAFRGGPGKAVKRYVEAFRTALIEDRNLCLCAVLGAENQGLPPAVVHRTRIFFEENLAWLQEALQASSPMKPAEARRRAAHILAALEGGMIVSQALAAHGVFEDVAEGVVRAATS